MGSFFNGSGRPLAPLRVLVIDQAGEAGGAQYSLLDFLSGHRGKAITVFLLTDGPFRAKLRELGFSVVVGKSQGNFLVVPRGSAPVAMLRGLRDMSALGWQAARLARKYDVIYANTQKSLLIGAIASAISRRPLVWHLRDILTVDDTSGAVQKIARFFANTFAARVIVNSQATGTSFAAIGGRAPTILVYNGIDAGRFDLASPLPPRPAGIAAQSPLIGVFCRLTEWKGQHIAIAATARIAGLHLMLVGGPLFGQQDYEARLREQAKDLGVADRIHFLGNRSDVASLMRLCDVVVHSSTLPEPFGRVVVEGMLSGRPVVATDAGGVPEIIDEGKTGLMVAPGDVDGLVAAITRLLDAPDEAAAMARTARISAIERFGVANYCSGVWKILEDVASPAAMVTLVPAMSSSHSQAE